MAVTITINPGKQFCLRDIRCTAVIPVGGFSVEEAAAALALAREALDKEAAVKEAKETGKAEVIAAKETAAEEARTAAARMKAAVIVGQMASLVRQNLRFSLSYVEFNPASLRPEQILEKRSVRIELTFLAVPATDEMTAKREAEFRRLVEEMVQIFRANGFAPVSTEPTEPAESSKSA